MKKQHHNIGIGVDMELISRFQQYKHPKDLFLKRIFTDLELEYCFLRKLHPEQHLAVRFAAKEALVKAMAPLARSDVSDFQHIEIVTRKNGMPVVVLHGKKFTHFQALISLSHTKDLAIAFALVILQ